MNQQKPQFQIIFVGIGIRQVQSFSPTNKYSCLGRAILRSCCGSLT